MWKDFFYFSKRERQGLLVLIVFIAGIFLGKWLFTPKKTVAVEAEPVSEIVSKNEPKNDSEMRTNYRSEETRNQRIVLDKVSKNVDRKEKEHTYYQPTSQSHNDNSSSNNYPKKEKLAEGTVIELNSSDTTQLMKIPGIGASYAKRIVAYRNILGGYYHLEQLQEVYGMYEELYAKITPYLSVNAEAITRLPVNTASLDKLKMHPYINFYQAKAIVEMRKKKGKLESFSELVLLEEFTEECLEKVKQYLEF
jgi:competence ComEA-like helix-hairpin-helix protein